MLGMCSMCIRYKKRAADAVLEHVQFDIHLLK